MKMMIGVKNCVFIDFIDFDVLSKIIGDNGVVVDVSSISN